MGIDQTFMSMVTARAAVLRLIPSSSRPIWDIRDTKAPWRPGGAGGGAMRVGGFPAGRAAAVLAMRWGGGKG